MFQRFLIQKIFVVGILLILFGAGCVHETGQKPNQSSESFFDFCLEKVINSNLQSGDVLALAQQETLEDYNFVLEKGGEIISLNQEKTFAVWWQPEDFDPANNLVAVSLHGHSGWATTDFKIWYPELAERHLAFVGLQWWFGRTPEENGYDKPVTIYQNIVEVLQAKNIPVGQVIFQGFSMGAARSYGVSLYDNLCGEKYFGVNIANSGPWEDDYPLYKRVLSGEFGVIPFSGTRWILFCGENDNDQFGLGHVCDGMQDSYNRLTEFGGSVDLFLRDPDGDHGSLMRNQENIDRVLEAALKNF